MLITASGLVFVRALNDYERPDQRRFIELWCGYYWPYGVHALGISRHLQSVVFDDLF